MDHQDREYLASLISAALHKQYVAGLTAMCQGSTIDEMTDAHADADAAQQSMWIWVADHSGLPPVAMVPVVDIPWRADAERSPQRRDSGAPPDL